MELDKEDGIRTEQDRSLNGWEALESIVGTVCLTSVFLGLIWLLYSLLHH